MATNIGVEGCALSKESTEKTAVLDNITNIAKKKTKKIQSEVNQIGGLSNTLNINRKIQGIPNTANTGYVGFSLMIEITDESGSTVVSYYLKEDNSRYYIENPHGLS